MSLLEALQNKKQALKHTETIITCADGRRFLENNHETVELSKQTYGFVVDHKPDNVPAKVTSNIYLGSQDCCDITVLSKYNVEYVLSIGVEPIHCFSSVTYKFVECLDLPETNIIDILSNSCVPFIKDAVRRNKNILVHCNAGVSRSSAVVIGFLMLENRLDFAQAYDIVKKVRSSAKPNAGFEKQLKVWTKSANT